MKNIITLAALSLGAFQLQAQITINQSDYASWTPSSDTFRVLTQFSASPSNNATWDMSTATYANSFTNTRLPETNAALPQVSFVEPSAYSFAALGYNSDIAYGITSQGIQRFGEIIARQADGIGMVTGNNADSLVFDDQVISYSSPRTMLPFPVTAGNNWSSVYDFNTDFHLTVTMFGIVNTPGYRRSHIVETDSVKGWGKMRVTDLNGQVSGYMDVLAVQSTVHVTDSFYLGGAPAPATLLGAFGLSQDLKDSTFRINYYRAGEFSPLMTVVYPDGSYGTPSGARTHASRLAPAGATGIAAVSNGSEVSIYPNPVIGGALHINTGADAQAHQWSYELFNMAGQKVQSGSLQSGVSVIGLNQGITGFHMINIYKDGKISNTEPILIQ